MGDSWLLVLLILFANAITNVAKVTRAECNSRDNATNVFADPTQQLESCLFALQDAGGDRFHSAPLTRQDGSVHIKILDMAINHLDLIYQTNGQFNVFADLSLSWDDARLAWDASDWGLEKLALRDTHRMWTPQFADQTACSMIAGCWSRMHDVELAATGAIRARLNFRYPSHCAVDFSRFPDEENECCLMLAVENARVVLELATRAQSTLENPVASSSIDAFSGAILPGEQSGWTVKTLSLSVAEKRLDVRHLGSVLRVCLHGERRKSTLRFALHVPMSIASIVMLLSPLLGDLRTQCFVKLSTLFLQTISFLFLCSITPPQGFGAFKPKIYSFYESVFVLALLSTVVTLAAVALSRVRRSVPPSHGLYLLAKLINRVLCCIDPDPSIAYDRQVDEVDNAEARVPVARPSVSDHTSEWRHVYIAGNNLVTGFCITIFMLICLVTYF